MTNINIFHVWVVTMDFVKNGIGIIKFNLFHSSSNIVIRLFYMVFPDNKIVMEPIWILIIINSNIVYEIILYCVTYGHNNYGHFFP
jgi:hypothetical protein